MQSVGSFEAKTHLPKLLERVARGETIQITRRGVPIARLMPIGDDAPPDPKSVADRIRQLRKGCRLKGVTIRQLLEQGRRF